QIGNQQYRLLQIDHHEAEKYSPIVTVNYALPGIQSLSFFPNPSPTGVVILQYFAEQNEDLNIQLYDLMGRLIFRAVEPVEMGKNQINLNFSALRNGLYVAQVEVNGEQYFERIIIGK
ncbi:MAG: T9SS type A sorting domain-containing protein, partial [Saprospiraceae bacterium]